MNVHCSHVLRTAVARAIAALCAAVVVTTARTAQAGINVWTSHGPPGGNVTALAIDPVLPSTVYAGTDGGVFRSTDGGATWAVANSGLTNPFVAALAIDPITPSTLYAGTGGGVFKSTDAAATWGTANVGLPTTDVRALAIDPSTPSTLYAGALFGGVFIGGVFKSIDAGATWGAALTDDFLFALAIDPSTPSTLYAATARGVFKSTDAGATWSITGLPSTAGSLAIDPITPSRLYAGTGGGGVYKSTDAGATWRAANDGLTNTDVRALAIDPITPSTLYAGTAGGVFKSTDEGATWSNTGLPTNVSALAIDPITPSTVYAGGVHGVFKSADSGATWGDIGLANARVSVLAIDPVAPSTRYAGTSFGVFKSTDAGATWIPSRLTRIPITALAIDPSTPSTLYAGTPGGGVFKSTDAGATWGAINTGLTNTDVRALAIDPVTPSTLHAGTAGGGVFSIQQVAGCIGDCRGDGTVTVDDLVTGVTIALDTRPLAACPSFDAGDDGRVTVDDLIAAVNNTLNGCPTEGPTERLSGTLFVTTSVANKVHALDAATGDVLASADTEERPIGVEKANGKVYVANETSGTISVYESATLAPLTVIPACDKPHHTAVSPDGRRFYAACLATNRVAVVDTATDALVGPLTSGAPGARTHQPWPTNDGERLWVANFETNDITEIDLQTGAILRALPLGARPVEVVVSPDATTAYVSIPEESKLMVFDLETSRLVAEPAVLPPENLMLSRDGRTILASYSYPRNPTAASIVDTETLTAVEVTLPGVGASHTELTPDAKFGFVSLLGAGTPETPNGIAVLDIEAAAVLAVYQLPGSVWPHAVRWHGEHQRAGAGRQRHPRWRCAWDGSHRCRRARSCPRSVL